MKIIKIKTYNYDNIFGTPGRLNQCSVFIQREGVFYGQCSELCGVYHGLKNESV